MSNDFNARLMEILERRDTARDVEKRLAATEAELLRESRKLSGLRKQLEQEGHDVAVLEGLSLTALFHALLGDKKERINKERRELLAAKLQFDECEGAIRDLGERVEELRRQRAALGDLDGEYKLVLAQKEKAIASSGGSRAKALESMTERLAHEHSAIRELQEAIAAGEAARSAIEETAKSLSSAGGWGMVDLLGGGLITTAMKHSNIDAARESAHRAQQLLRRFHTELADVQEIESAKIDIEIGGFLTFADYFLDGLLADWLVQSRISNAAKDVDNALNSVHQTVSLLRTSLENKKRDSERLQAEQRRMVEGA